MKKTLLKTIYNIGGFAPFHLANRRQLLVLMYHRFSREPHPYKISAGEFAAHLEYLSKHNRVLSLSEAVENLKNEKPLPPNAAVITIDDGYADAYDVAFPILKKFEMPAVVYAVTNFLDEKCWLWTDLMRYILHETKAANLNVEIENGKKIEAKLNGGIDKPELAALINRRLKLLTDERKDLKIKEIAEKLKVKIPELPTRDYAPMTWAQAAEMDANAVNIESHTVSHPILTNINQSRLDEELINSKRRLEEKLNRKIEHFCYPNGNLNANVRQSVEKAGYNSAVTTDYGFNGRQANKFTLNRIDAASPIEKFAQSASGFEAFRKKF